MRIGNGPRLVIPRAGQPGRRGWYGQWRDRGEAYDLHREQERSRMRVMPRNPTGDRKLIATSLRRVQPGQWCRQVDAHGRSFGPRLQREADLPRETRVRIARRQEEDIHSLMSRMLTRAHKAED